MFGKVCTARDVRIETLRLNSKRIREMNLEGNVAELGVYKGSFSKYINRYFPDRKLYLFDTFEGFLVDKLKRQTDDYFMAQLKSVSLVDYCKVDDFQQFLNEFEYPENLIIKKGFFPDTTDGIDDSFIFVSIDVDIYQTTLDGLEFFYPRMKTGGIIMIHDYNCIHTRGVKPAVDEFCKKENIIPVMVADGAGTALIIKN